VKTGPNDHPVAERLDDVPVRVGRFVHDVVPGDGGVAPVMRGESLPQVHGPVLEVPVGPEPRLVRLVVAVPVLVLRAGQCVEVQDRVQAVPPAVPDGPVEQREPLLLQLERPGIIFEMPVVERDADRVQAEGGEVACVGVVEEDRHEPVEEGLVELRSEHPAQHPPVLRLGARVAGEEVLHVQPAADVVPAQDDRLAGAVDDGVAPDAQDLTRHR
jgi:hypothetical protein